MILCNDLVTQRNDMTKNLNIRLEDETFEAFTQWCNSNRYSKTEILKDYIEKLISGKIQPSSNASNDGNDMGFAITSNASNDMGEAIANHPKITAFEDRLERLESTLNQLVATLSVNLSDNVMTCNESNASANNTPIITDNDNNEVIADKDKDNIITDNDTALQIETSEDSLEGASNEIQEQSPLEENEPILEANNEIRLESEETNTAETTTQTGIEDKKSKSTKLQKRTRLTKDELDHAIEVKDLEALLDLPLTEKLGKRKVVSHLKEKCDWVNTKLGDIKLNKLNTATADEIIREYCQR